MRRYLIEERERFGSEFAGPAFPMRENATAIVRDGRAPSGDLIDGLAEVGVETDVAIEGEGRGGDGQGRVAGVLFVCEQWIIRSASALAAGAERELRTATFGMMLCDLDLLHELSDRTLPVRTGWPSVGHGPAPGVALEERSRGIFDRGRKLLRPVSSKDLDRATTQPVMLMWGISPGSRAARGEVLSEVSTVSSGAGPLGRAGPLEAAPKGVGGDG